MICAAHVKSGKGYIGMWACSENAHVGKLLGDDGSSSQVGPYLKS